MSLSVPPDTVSLPSGTRRGVGEAMGSCWTFFLVDFLGGGEGTECTLFVQDGGDQVLMGCYGGAGIAVQHSDVYSNVFPHPRARLEGSFPGETVRTPGGC